jgi:hypothetical protein
MYGKLNSEDRIVLLVAQVHLLKAQQEELLDLVKQKPDWQKIAESIKNNSLSAIFFYNISRFIPETLIPKEIYDSFKQAYYLNVKRNMLLEVELIKILTRYRELKIQTVLLKGLSLGREIYGNLALRQSVDLDLLVKHEDVKTAYQVLFESGYQKTNIVYNEKLEENFHVLGKHMPDVTNGFNSVDLHVSLFPFHKKGLQLMDLVWDSLTAIDYDGFEVFIPGPEFLVIYGCEHLDHHRVTGNFLLKQYLDLAEICRKYENQLDWDKLIRICEQYELTQVCWKHLFLVSRFFEVSLPQSLHIRIEALQDFNPEKEESLFIQEMRIGKMPVNDKIYPVKYLFAGINNLPTIKSKLQLVYSGLFPSKEFMVKRYNIKNQDFYYLYYFRRISTALKMLSNYRPYGKS